MVRTLSVHLRFSPVEKAAAEQAAKRAGLTLSEHIRRRACGELPESLRGPWQRGPREEQREAKRVAAAEKARAVLAGM